MLNTRAKELVVRMAQLAMKSDTGTLPVEIKQYVAR
jgi:hypothetical protein